MTYDVAILGGGAAGLLAARDLARSGRSCIVIEASDSLGGRMREAIDPRANAPIELGAEFVHGTPSITLALLREYGASRIECEGRSLSREASGQLCDRDDELVEAASALLARADRSKSETVTALLDRVATTRDQEEAARWARAFVAGFDAADPAIASAVAITDEWTRAASVGGGQSRPLGGYAALTRHLACALPQGNVRISLRSRVTRVTTTSGGVRLTISQPEGAVTTANRNVGATTSVRDDGVETERNGMPFMIDARAAIVTLPIGVLKCEPGMGGVAFDPPLDAAKRDALNGLVMGPVLKVVLRFAHGFWEEASAGAYDCAAFFHDDDGAFPTYWTQYPLRATTIVAWAGGPAAERLAADVATLDAVAAKTTLVERALDEFGALIGADARAAFEAGYLHDWQRDPLFRGAYSYVAAGGETARADHAAARPPLFFAGEATAGDGEGGTVAGALWSGERAAREAHAYLG